MIKSQSFLLTILRKNVLFSLACAALLTCLAVSLSGCTSRGLTVTSNPPGAELSINNRVIGITPMRVGFTHYGTYRIELRKKNYQTLVKEVTVNPPLYGYDPPAVIADNLIPVRLNDEIYINYVMKPLDGFDPKAADKDAAETPPPPTDPSKSPTAERDALIARAEMARSGKVTDHAGATVDLSTKLPLQPAGAVAVAPADTAATADTVVPVVNELESVKEINAKPPEGLRLAQRLGLADTESDKKGTFLQPDSQKPAPARVVRVPKEEELIYVKPIITDPSDKKKDDNKSAKENKDAKDSKDDKSKAEFK